MGEYGRKKSLDAADEQLIIDHWRAVVRDYDPQDEPDAPDIRPHYPPDYFMRVCHLVVESNFAQLPETGGWNQQDPLFLDDLQLYLRGLRRARWEKDNPDVIKADEALFANAEAF